jgi:hypothetical protein
MSDMQPRSSFDRTLLIPVGIGIVSILGICSIFLIGRLGKTVSPPTATPSSFSFLETATRTPSPSATSTRDKLPPTVTRAGPDAYPGPLTETLPPTSTLTETPPTPSATLTPDQIQPLPVGKYDDTDPNIAYDPYWAALKNPSTANSYNGTIHASADIGSEASFRFTGERFRLGYQRGKSFGTVTVLVDDQPHNFHEQALDLVWSSPRLSPGDHFVRIIHESGESINLDYIEILD